MKRPEIVSQISEAIKEVAPTATAILYGSEAFAVRRACRGGSLPSAHMPCPCRAKTAKISRLACFCEAKISLYAVFLLPLQRNST